VHRFASIRVNWFLPDAQSNGLARHREMRDDPSTVVNSVSVRQGDQSHRNKSGGSLRRVIRNSGEFERLSTESIPRSSA
jgi:hypothetical protein